MLARIENPSQQFPCCQSFLATTAFVTTLTTALSSSRPPTLISSQTSALTAAWHRAIPTFIPHALSTATIIRIHTRTSLTTLIHSITLSPTSICHYCRWVCH
ncbi:hypothetical protein [Methylobacter tundripaludum]|uniref:hypothetical protein n=1 Tax=Methylobacter tundripaludum TaxID=173365 RepID=UPI0012696CFE|nr:hypothetical protein [Methylobacter tundripaludum]